jgi:hypothetical protein
MVQLQEPVGERRRGRHAPFERDPVRHRRILSFLDHHPLVRRIELPPILTRTIIGERMSARSAAGAGRERPNSVTLAERNSARTYPKVGVIDGGVGPALNDWVIHRWDFLSDTDATLTTALSSAGWLLVATR